MKASITAPYADFRVADLGLAPDLAPALPATELAGTATGRLTWYAHPQTRERVRTASPVVTR